jgi:hypothetical protein
MKPATPSPSVDPDRAQQLSNALSQVDRLVQQGCAEMASIAQLALAWLETPEGHRQFDVVAHALQTIRNGAEALADYAGTEAREMGCGYDDPAEQRRSEAAEAAARIAAYWLERRNQAAARTEG